MSLQIWLPLNGSLDEKISNKTFTNINATIDNAGKIGKCYYFNGSSAQLIHQLSTNDINAINSLSEFSIACWVKLANGTSDNTGYGQILTFGNQSTSWNDIRIGFDNGGSSKVYFSVSNGTDNAGGKCFSNATIRDNKWHHLIGVYKNRQLIFYVDGTQQSTTYTTTFVPKLDATSYIIVGGNSSEKPKCCLNDVRFYDHALSPREVKLLAQGLVAHYKLDDPSIEPTTNILNGVWQHTNFSQAPLGTYSLFSNQLGSGSSIEVRQFNNRQCLYIKGGSGEGDRCYRSIAVSGDKSYTFSLDLYSTSTTNVYIKCEANGGDYGSSWPTIGSANYTTPNQWQRLSFTMNPNTNPTLYFFIQTPNNNEVYVDNIQLEEKDHATPYTPSSREGKTAYDCSGYGHHCSTNGGYPLSYANSPRYTNYYQFNGNTSNIIYNTTTQFNYTDNFSWVCWVKHNYPNTTSYAFTVGRADWGPNWGYGLQEYSSSSMLIRFGSWTYNIPLDTNWHHVGFTKTGSTLTTYVDGIPTVHNFTGALPDYTYSNGLGIGCFWYSGGAIYPYYGSISDFRIYATALSAAAVKELYQSSISFLDNGTLQCSEIVESSTNLKYNQNGITQAELINENPFVPLMKQKTLSDGSTWARIHWLDVSQTPRVYFTVAEVQECTNANNRFSLMKYVDYFKRPDGYYEFMLTHPKLSTTSYNRWRQTSSPNSDTVEGFSTIGAQAWTEANHGIRQHGGDCIYNCDEGGTWFAPIGQTKDWGGGIPAANQSNTPTAEIELWVRIDKNMKLLNNAIQATQIYEL